MHRTTIYSIALAVLLIFGGSAAAEIDLDPRSDVLCLRTQPSNDPGRTRFAASWITESDSSGAWYGNWVTSGDFNGDGFGDVVICAPHYKVILLEDGKVFVYYGGPGGPGTTPDWTAETDQVGSQFGSSAASADFNNDGYDDLAIGAERYDNGITDEGVVFVWFGSASGLGVNGTPSNADWLAESNDGMGRLGETVANAGDVNNDGYDDLIAGGEGIDLGTLTEEGAAFVWLGDASGFRVTSGTPTNAVWTRRGGQIRAYLEEVAGAGDVNGDGYDDVVVGARGYDNGHSNEGRAWLFYGRASGVSTGVAWQGEGDDTNMFFGRSLAGPGDLNNDGYDDLVVGGGRFGSRVYYGSASGLGPNGTPDNADWSSFNLIVAPAGDVNNDGISDLLNSSNGNAAVYLGADTALAAVYTWRELGDYAARFGGHCWSAGDVNGDNFDDVIVGAYFHSNGQTEEGAAYLFLANIDFDVPTTLQSYSAHWVEGIVELNWRLIEIEGALTFEVDRKHSARSYEPLSAPDIARIEDTFTLRDPDTQPGKTFTYRVAVLENGEHVAGFEASVSTPSVALELYPNYPNPFNPATSIRFSLNKDADVTLGVYDTAGRLVRTLVHRPMRAGIHTETWNGISTGGELVASGVYFVRLRAGKVSKQRKIVLLK